MPKDARGHGSNSRGTAPGTAGRDRMGRTYTQAIRDHDRFPKQNPTMPNADEYATDQAAASVLAAGNPKATPAPVHEGASGPAYGSPEAIKSFTDRYGGPKDHARAKRGFASGKREINRLRRQGK